MQVVQAVQEVREVRKVQVVQEVRDVRDVRESMTEVQTGSLRTRGSEVRTGQRAQSPGLRGKIQRAAYATSFNVLDAVSIELCLGSSLCERSGNSPLLKLCTKQLRQHLVACTTQIVSQRRQHLPSVTENAHHRYRDRKLDCAHSRLSVGASTLNGGNMWCVCVDKSSWTSPVLVERTGVLQ